MGREITAKTMSVHGFTQFELTKRVLNNLSQFRLKPTTINVLLYLTSCYNPKNQYVFPKQKTIAAVFNCSERSVVRAIQELVKEGLIIVECKYTNRYRFTSRVVGEASQNEKKFCGDKMSDTTDKISSQSDNLSPACIEQTKEQEKEQTYSKWGNVYSMEEYAILKEYALKHTTEAQVDAYIAGIRNRGGDKSILKKHRLQRFITQRAQTNIAETKRLIEQQQELHKTAVLPCESEAWNNLRTKFSRK